MKYLFYFLLGACFAALVSITITTEPPTKYPKRNVTEINAVDFLLIRSDIKHSDDITSHFSVKQIIEAERAFISKFLPDRESDQYMSYFTKGLTTNVGGIMVEGEYNLHLESAFWRGKHMRGIVSDSVIELARYRESITSK